MSAASYATVTATFPDPPAGLEVRFRPTLTQPIARLTTVVPPLLYAVDEITVPVAEDGQLRGPDGQPGVRLLADPDLEPSGFTWQVRIVSPVTAPVEFAIAVTGGATVDLASVVPVPADLGQALTDWLQAVTAAQAARDEALAAAADAAGGSADAIRAALAELVGAAPDALNTLQEIDATIAADEGSAAALAALVASKAPKDSPTFTGTVAGITAAMVGADPAGAAAAVTLAGLGGLTQAQIDARVTELADVKGAAAAVTLAGLGGVSSSTQLALLTPRRLQGQRVARQLTAFQAGHPFTVFLANGGTWNLNDTSDAALGSQCVSVTTGTGGTRSEIRSATLPAFDLTTNSLKVWVKADPATFANLSKVTMFVGETTSNGYTVDLWARGANQTIADLSAGWVAFTSDLAYPFNYGTPTTKAAMTVVGLSATASNGTAAKVYFGGMGLVAKTIPPLVTFGFDDGYVTQYTNARPKLDQYGFPATAYVIQDLIGSNPSSYLSLTQCHALEDQSGWEIAGHSATVADHSITGGFTALTDAQLRANMETNKRWLIGNGFRGVDHTAYPQGFYNDAVAATARDYWTTARTVYSGGALELPRPTYAHRMRCIEIDAGVSAATLEAHVDRVKQNGGWLQFYLHQVTASPTGASTDPATFGALVDYVAASGVAVRTVGEVIALAQSSADEIPAFLGAVT